ncbi:MAG: efflux RND transporter permease subunit [Armatimonadota bacterium]
MAPEEIEAQITRPIEQALSSAPGLYQISSTSSMGSSSVRVQFRWGVDIEKASIDIMQRLERVKRRFPDDSTLQTPSVLRFDPNQMPILSLAFYGEKDIVKLRTLLENQISPIIESADGVASVNVSGGQPRAILINVDPVRLRAHHVTLSDIMRRLSQENINVPAGIAQQSETEYTIRSMGWLTSLDEVTNLPLAAPNGQIVTINDVADVQDSYQEPRNFSRLNGQPSVGLSISKQSGANTIATAKAVKERLKRVEQLYPHIKNSIAYDQSVFVENSVHHLMTHALIGGVLAVLVLLFFLRNIRSTLVVALSIPISIISTFSLLELGGLTLNTMSLSGLALATGLIVDDAVVVIENIFRHLERDKRSVRDAAITGTQEILSAVIASTWTVMVVFLPLLLIKGQSGQMFSQFALVVIFSLAVSLLVATTIVPMLSTRIISGEAHAEMLATWREHPTLLMRLFLRFGAWFTELDEVYRNGLRWALSHRWWTVGGALAITLGSLLLLPYVGKEMMPATDSGNISVSVRMPPGTALAKTDRVMRQVEEIVQQNPNVETAYANVGGGGGFGGGRGGGAGGSVSMRLRDKRQQTSDEIVEELRGELGRIPGVRPRIQSIDIVSRLMSGGSQFIEMNIFGNDLNTLSRLSRAVMGDLRDVSGLENLDVNWQESMPELQWKVDRQKAAQLGITFRDISDVLSVSTNGSTATYYQEGGYQYPIIVQLPEAERKTVDAMANLVVTPSGGGNGKQGVTLRQVARYTFAEGPNQITRQNRQRFISVTGIPSPERPISDIQRDVERAFEKVQFPSGYYWEWGTSQQQQAEEFTGLSLAVILAIAIIYMLLAAQFESLRHPLAIMLSVPLAVTGVILALFLTDRSFGLTALIGMLMLVGIVVKNGILLVDYTNTLRRRGIARNEAILTAAPTRLRPILMTAFATMFGMLPIALGLGHGSEIHTPMATTVIGGLLTSTLLTLFVVPVAYSFLDDLATRRRGGVDQHEMTSEEADAEEQSSTDNTDAPILS